MDTTSNPRRALSILALFLLCQSLWQSATVAWTYGQSQFQNITFTGNKTYSGASGTGNSWMWMDGTNVITGNASSASPTGTTAPFQVFANDNVNTTSGDGELSLFAATLAPNGSIGNRNAIKGYIEVVGAPGSGTPNYVGVLGLARVAANQGGATGAITNYKGQVFGANSNAFANSGATFLQALVGHEYDVEAQTGSSVARKIGLLVANGAADAVSGVYEDALIELASQDGAVAMKCVVCVGGYSVQWPTDTNGTIFGAVARTAPSPATPAAKWGLDLSAVSFNVAGAPIIAPLITPASSAATCTTGSIKWDASFIYVCTSTNAWKRAAISTW
jgi:hypothetical protein